MRKESCQKGSRRWFEYRVSGLEARLTTTVSSCGISRDCYIANNRVPTKRLMLSAFFCGSLFPSEGAFAHFSSSAPVTARHTALRIRGKISGSGSGLLGWEQLLGNNRGSRWDYVQWIAHPQQNSGRSHAEFLLEQSIAFSPLQPLLSGICYQAG